MINFFTSERSKMNGFNQNEKWNVIRKCLNYKISEIYQVAEEILKNEKEEHIYKKL